MEHLIKKSALKLMIAMCSLLSFKIQAQQIKIGAHGAINNYEIGIVGLNVEARLKDSPFSLNVDPQYVFVKAGVATIPVYAKYIFGDKFAVSPALGLFVRPTYSMGWLGGFHFDYQFAGKWSVFSNVEYYWDYWKAYGWISKWPIDYSSDPRSKEHSWQLSLGFKYALK